MRASYYFLGALLGRFGAGQVLSLIHIFKSALEQVQATGYGIVMPGIEELHLEEPEIVRQGG